MRNRIWIGTSLLTMAYLPSMAFANIIEPIYPDKLKIFNLGSEVCGTDYRTLTRDEAQSVKSSIVNMMGTWQISGLANHWVIMGPGYYGEIKQGSASNTWCYPTNDNSDTIPVLSTNEIPAGDEIDVQWKLVNDRNNFVKPNSYLTHYLGYAWVGGDHSDYVGEDMDITREGDGWLIKGNNQGSCDGYRCRDKSTIRVNNFAYTLDENRFSHGSITESNKELVKTISANAVNNTDVPQQVVINLRYDTSTDWSKTNTYGLSEKVTTKNTFKWPLVGETELSIEIAANQSWASQNGGSETNGVTVEARPMIPAHSSIPIKIALYKSSISYPYQFSADISYDITLNGFLRWGGNAWHTHPENRPTRSHTFTVGRWKDNASSINYQWDKRYIQGEVNWWDWSWMIKEYGLSTMKNTLAKVLRPTSSSVKGNFFAESQFAGDIEIGNAPTKSTLQRRSKRDVSAQQENKNVQLNDVNFTIDELESLGFNDVKLSITTVNQ
ncbi:aerolysin family beta-barrel pore-forming toxin [Shewanella sp. VB17]|uniref:aerolysin family beta-barrel pore-forming toxin n=1 Tax=Shewanella sp. VB17 TaxID=2739432 RepID=UPI001566A94A|nr:aerolysin family beta-barrel pore-forming toxin [Shewanella sp. VB17]NRD74398.1 aerolysin family beta-barrel pore-forming toxin [Shewanella sp. VB17]